jgi:lysophospholipase L1-like esterase
MLPRLTLRTVTCAAVTAAVAVTALLTAGPATAAPSRYVALGDSYSSGTGTGTYLPDGTSCLRSVYAYPSLVASSKGYALDLRACSGATTADVSALQLSAVDSTAAYVSLTIGGNDAGFAAVLTECAKPAWASNCNGAVDKAVTTIDTVLPARLTSLYAAVRSRAPQATVVVAGYPRVFNGQDCNALTWFSPTEEARLNATADRLNSRIAAAARAAGVRYTNPTAAFVGHAVCDTPAWINGLSFPVVESFHPNRLGQSSGYAPLVGSVLTGSTVTAAVTTSSRTLRLAEASAGALVARQRPHAAKDRRITRKDFVAPDLDSPQMKAAAARAGVDLSSRASIDEADRRYERLAAAEAARRTARPH